MIQERFVGPHCILVFAEVRQPLFDEMLQAFPGVLGSHRPVEGRKIAGMIRENFFDGFDDGRSDLVRFESDDFG